MATVEPSEKIKTIDRAYHELNLGQSAEAILRVLDPLVEERLGLLLNQFRQCPPELGPLLDFRAKITELWNMRKELNDAKKKGVAAKNLIEALVLRSTN